MAGIGYAKLCEVIFDVQNFYPAGLPALRVTDKIVWIIALKYPLDGFPGLFLPAPVINYG